MVKKSYNPFKMWGAWIGAILGFLFIPLKFVGVFGGSIPVTGAIATYAVIIGNVPITELWVALVGTTIGFLAGWGIHSLIRRKKK